MSTKLTGETDAFVIANTLAKYDRDGDGRIDKSEFAVFLRDHPHLQEAMEGIFHSIAV